MAAAVCRCSNVEARPRSDPGLVECDRFCSTMRTGEASVCWHSAVDSVVVVVVAAVGAGETSG